MPTYKTQTVILKIKDLGEFDQLVTFYTKDFGKLALIAKSIKKPTAKLKEQLALFNLAKIKIAQGKTIDKLATIFVTESFLKIKSSLGKTAAGFMILEIMDKLITGQQKDEGLWQLLLGVLDYLESLTVDSRDRSATVPTIKKIQICLAIFQIKMLKNLGFEPNLYQCVKCRKKLQPQANVFCLKQGGILCYQCSNLNNKTGFNKQKLSWQKSNTNQANPGFPARACAERQRSTRNDKDFSNAQYYSHSHHLIPLSATTIKLWRFLTNQSLKRMPPIKISPAILNQLSQVLTSFLECTSSQQLHSWQFYRKIIKSSTN